MVHTRHSGEVDSHPIFLSLEDKRARKARLCAPDDEEQDSDHSRILYNGKDDSMEYEEKIQESRLRPRTGPRRAYNYVYGDSSEDEMMSRHRRARMMKTSPFKMSGGRSMRRSMRREERQVQASSDEEEEEELRARWKSTRSRHNVMEPRADPSPGRNLRRRVKEEKEGSDEEEDGEEEEEEKGDEEDGEEEEGEEGEGDEDEEEEEEEEEGDANNSAVRRSSRLSTRPLRFLSRTKNGDRKKQRILTMREKRRRSDQNNSNEDFTDMYSRVKRPRRCKMAGEEDQHSASQSEDEKHDTEDEAPQRRSYSLREHKPVTQRYTAPSMESKKRNNNLLFRESPPRTVRRKKPTYHSPAHRKIHFRKRKTIHGNSSSTSSDPSDSGAETSDEQRFNRRRAKSLAKNRARICPLNFTPDMVTSQSVLKDRVRSGASLADVDPMEIDKSVRFDSVGGLQKHITALKEMVVFPLLYPEFYERFKVAPSRGVLFYGPPGTGKTLMARALANECSQGAQKVAFFMRKGADCLSKWVGEAERQLRLLFDKAYEMRPSIIFFDEIDGLAPVRSSRQDQIHSSIVSTLLALMDGIDSRGEIVVIGATNRVDSIDPALRRPGRFDREFNFPLPNLEDRKKILKIHTTKWNPALRDDFITEVAEKCSGYCGADIKCLVTEASHSALRRTYPQIYTTSDKLQLDIGSITLKARDFLQAMKNIVPASQRAVPNPALALEVAVRPLLARAMNGLQAALCAKFPFAQVEQKALAVQGGTSGASSGMQDLDLPSDEEENAPSIFQCSKNNRLSSASFSSPSFLQFSSSSSAYPVVFRPRMLVSGAMGQGQSVHLAPAALHLMEHLPVHTLSSATLFAASAKMPEEACSNVFHEAKRTAPSVIYMPYLNELWGVISDSLRVTFLTLVRSMSPSTPILILATSESPYFDLDDQLKILFSMHGGEVVEVEGPSREERRQFFSDLILHQAARPPPTHTQAARRILEPLAKAKAPEPRKLTEKEEKMLKAQEEDTLRELRIFLRDILGKLGREKKFSIFTKPVDIEDVPDYYEIIKNPMDLSTMMANIDLHKYATAAAFLSDVFLITDNALEYNPDHGPTDRAIRHRACALRDTAQALLKDQLDPDFERMCQEIQESRKCRGVDSSKSAPAFYHTQPSGSDHFSAGNERQRFPLPPSLPDGSRYSRRVRGLEADKALPVEAVERTATVEKTLLRKAEDTLEEDASTESVQQASKEADDGQEKESKDSALQSPKMSPSEKKEGTAADVLDCKCPVSSTKKQSPSPGGSKPKVTGSSEGKSSVKAKMIKKCPWLATRRRRRFTSTPNSQRRSNSPSKQHRSEEEEGTEDESMDTSPAVASIKPSRDSWEGRARGPRDDSPVSAANPANVQMSIATRTRRSSGHGAPEPTPTEPAPAEGSQEREEESQAGDRSKADAPADTKPGSARNLDVALLAVAVDSGLGSESNGDSRDSLDTNNSNRNGSQGQSVDGSQTPTESQETGPSISSAAGPSLARTRARSQDPLQLRALEALEAAGAVQAVKVDRERLGRLLDTVVAKTSACTVETLQQLYSVLSCHIYANRRQPDKAALLQEMEDAVNKFCPA